eukprot:gb/GECG01014302.1/.p1 GENE.gb/GECG01014302.1/~~gb/GECG01014302.1/.p1  ORF type:complete len:274 (+),score=18.56 gb/GECG01014302.1/:1-822(+)
MGPCRVLDGLHCVEFSCSISRILVVEVSAHQSFCVTHATFSTGSWCSSGGLYSVLSTNQNVASAIVGPVLLFFVSSDFGWKASFYVPSLVAAAIAGGLIIGLRDTASQAQQRESQNTETRSFKDAATVVLKDYHLWLLATSYFLISVCRTFLSDWAYIMLGDVFGMAKGEVNFGLFYLEVGGLCGGLGIGFLSDIYFNGAREPLMAISSMLAANTFALLLLASAFQMNQFFIYVIYFFSGLFTFGPHVLIGLVARELTATGRSASNRVNHWKI